VLVTNIIIRLRTPTFISRDKTWAPLLKDPIRLYTELLAQPANIKANTLKLESNNWKRIL
jgi:hypothetical protein